MNISKIFPKSRQQLIESLEFSSFKFFLKVVNWCRDWELVQVREYKQLLFD